MRSLLTIIALCISIMANAQTFNCTAVPGAITDNNTVVTFPITVSGLFNAINPSFGISNVRINISHANISDLKISLTSPTGTSVILSLHNGGQGANYTNTTFQMSATMPIGFSSAPFSGSFIPDNSINAFNNNQNPNGVWQIEVIDVFPTVAGTFLSGSIFFSNNPPPDPTQGNTCTVTNATGCVCKDNTLSNCNLLPDLIVSAKIIRDGWNETTGTVAMPNAVINIGSGPVEMKPTNQCFCDSTPVTCTTTLCPSGMPPKQRVNQRIYHKNNNVMTFTDVPGGVQSYHAAHGHVHAEDFCEFTLRTPTSNPDATTWPIIGYSLKQGYCMINMGDCNSQDSICMSHGTEITNAMLPNLNLGVVTGCGANGQGIFVGRYDLYGAGFGQTIQVPGICNGNYYIVTRIDPNNNYQEEDETNNWVAVPVTLTQQAGAPLNAAYVYGVSNLTVGFFNYTPNVTRTWDFGDGTALVTAPYPTHTYAMPGTYLVTLTVSDGTCASSSTQSITVGITGINENTSGINEINIYPNPSKDIFTLSFETTSSGNVQVELLNMLGENVKTISAGQHLAGKHTFELNNLAAGTYFVKLTSQDKVLVKKLVKL
jgi:subtilisin-like proprotein convertase family protein